MRFSTDWTRWMLGVSWYYDKEPVGRGRSYRTYSIEFFLGPFCLAFWGESKKRSRRRKK